MKTLKWILSTAIIPMAISCQQPATEQASEQTTPPPPPDHSALVNSFLAAMDANDSTALFANCADNFVCYHPNYSQPLDRAAFMKHIRMINSVLSNAKHTALESISSANAVASRGILNGKNTGSFMGNPPTNNDVNVDWLCYVVLDESGKMKTLYVQFNQMSFLAQLGVKLPGT